MVNEDEITNNKLDKYYRMNILDIETIFQKKSFDIVCAFGVIEHLTKDDGLKLIKIMEKIKGESWHN